MKKLMYKVYVEFANVVLFEKKIDADQYIILKGNIGEIASLNKFQWEVEIEK